MNIGCRSFISAFILRSNSEKPLKKENSEIFTKNAFRLKNRKHINNHINIKTFYQFRKLILSYISLEKGEKEEKNSSFFMSDKSHFCPISHFCRSLVTSLQLQLSGTFKKNMLHSTVIRLPVQKTVFGSYRQ